MIEKWVKIKYEYCQNCFSKKKSLITYFVHSTEDYDSEDYWCTIKNCSCGGKICGNYVKVCSKCKYSGELNESEIDMID